MAEFLHRSELPVSPEALFAWHMRHGAFERLAPPDQDVSIGWRDPGGTFEGSRVCLRLGPGPFKLSWVARHEDIEPGRAFTDRQESGPFAAWSHRHTCLPAATPGRAVLEDRIQFRVPLAPLTAWAADPLFKRMLAGMFRFRHRRTAVDLERHQVFADQPRLQIAISGATGLIGRNLCAYLGTAGHTVRPMTRGRLDPTLPVGGEPIPWDPARGQLDGHDLAGTDAVIHLAGASVGERWTPEHKDRILASRLQGTRLIAEALAALPNPPKVLLCASAIGYYGYDDSERPYTEDDTPGDGFLAEVTRQWEAAAQPAVDAGIRVVFLRIGVVLSPHGGALQRLLPPARLGLGGPVGGGQQWLSWITLDDTLGAIEHLLHRDDLSGPFNLTAPTPVRQREFAQGLGSALHRPAFLPIPAAALRLAFGEMSEVVLKGVRVLPTRLQASGFSFLGPDLTTGLRHELGLP